MAFLNFIFKDKGEGNEKGRKAPRAAAPGPEPEDPSDDVNAIEPSPASAAVPALGASEAPPSGMTLPDNEEEMNLDQLVEALRLISTVLVEAEEPKEDSAADRSDNGTAVFFTLEQISDLLTDAFDAKALATADTTRRMKVLVDRVYEQLGTGKVRTTVARVLAAVPPELIVAHFNRRSGAEVILPLQLVVSCLQPDELEKRTAPQSSEINLDDMPNLFSGVLPGAATADPADAEAEEEAAAVEEEAPTVADREYNDPFAAPPQAMPRAETPRTIPPAPATPSAAPVHEDPAPAAGPFKFELVEGADIFNFNANAASDTPAAPAPVKPEAEAEAAEDAVTAEIEPEPTRAPTPADVTTPSFQEAAPEPVPQSEPEIATQRPVAARAEGGEILLQGLDLNAATAQEISARVVGVGPRLAARIVRHREVNGPFKRVTDLALVQGVGPSTYEKMTGASWSEARDSLRRTLDFVLGAEAGSGLDLKAVARRVSTLRGFDGCIIAHTDGHVLTASWPDEKREILGAVAPQVFKKLMPYIEELDISDLNLVTLFLGETAIAVQQSGHVIIATIHHTSAFGRKQTRLIELIGSELEQRLETASRPA